MSVVPYTLSQFFAIGFSVVIALMAILYGGMLSELIPTQPKMLTIGEQTQLLSSLVFHTTKRHREEQEQVESQGISISRDRRPRLAFCCSADLDVSVRAVDLMTRVHQQEQHLSAHKKKKTQKETLDRIHHERIGTLRDLQESFAYYFANGAAAEQSMSSPEQFREIVKFANELSHVKHKVGGNAATMADRASVEGCDVLLGAAIGKEMRKHFNDKIQLVGHVDDHEHEDVHLVLEYGKGDVFRGHTTPRANRYYLNHDIYNARLSVLEEFEDALTKFQPDLVVFGGLQLMEVETDEERRLARLTKLSEVLQNLFVAKTPSHYEFAAVSDFTLFDDTVRLILPWVDSIGLNEQELFILHHYLVTGEEATATNSRPTIAQVSQQLSDVISFAAKARLAFQSKTSSRSTKQYTALAQLTRIHFHTLQFHIICQEEESEWENPTTALIQSALMSTKLACGKDSSDPSIMRPSSDMQVDSERVEILMERHILLHQQHSTKTIDPFAPVMTWKEQSFQCFMVPMLACKKPDHTAGLGDNISGTGMAYHQVKKK